MRVCLLCIIVRWNCLIEYISHPLCFFLIIFHASRSKLHTYDDVVERVARQLELDDPAKIRLTSHNCYSQQPKPQPVKYRGVEHLLDMLIHYNQVNLFRFFWSIWAWFLVTKCVGLPTKALSGTDVWHLVLWSVGYTTARIAVPENPKSRIPPSYEGWGLFCYQAHMVYCLKYCVYIFIWYPFSRLLFIASGFQKIAPLLM